MSEVKAKDIAEVRLPEAQGFKEIKPEKISNNEARLFWDKKFDSTELNDNELQTVLDKYIDDIKKYCDIPETIPNQPIAVSDLRHVPPLENASQREQFNSPDFKKELKHQWELANNMPWPKYNEDVYITCSGGRVVKIREAGQDYDAHHIQPLCLGGKNDASNLVPLRADVHFDHRGVHQLGGAFDQLNKMLGGGEQ